MATRSNARNPNTSESLSNNPPMTAPSTFAFSAALGEAVCLNSAGKRIPANHTGKQKMIIATATTVAGGAAILSNGNQ